MATAKISAASYRAFNPQAVHLPLRQKRIRQAERQVLYTQSTSTSVVVLLKDHGARLI
jgi:hypothetical protein